MRLALCQVFKQQVVGVRFLFKSGPTGFRQVPVPVQQEEPTKPILVAQKLGTQHQ